MGSVEIDRTRCLLCGACVGSCPFLALELLETYVEWYKDRCTLCGICERACPVGAITVRR